jgi:hypothetical protein
VVQVWVEKEKGTLERNTDNINPESNDFRDREDIDMEGDVDPREGIILDWDILAEGFIVEAEEFGKFEHFLLHTL